MKNLRLIQDFIIPALDQETYGDLLEWDSEPGVFKIKWTHKARSSWTEEDSRVFIAWDLLKGRPIPQTHQEFVDSKQRLRAALRNLRTVEDVPSNDIYRRYRITDLLEIRVKGGRKVEIPEIKTEVKESPVLPRRRSRRKVKIEKCMYNDDDSSDSWSERIKPPRKPRRAVNPRKIKSTKEESEGHLEPKISPVPTKETGAIPKIKVEAAKKETCTKPKLPRSLACILDSLNVNYDRSVGPRRTTKVSQEVWASSLGLKQEEPTYSSAEKQMEVWASSLGLKQEEPTYSSAEKQMEPTTSKYLSKQNCPKTEISANGEKTPNSSVPAPEASDKTKKKSKGCVPTTEVSANSEKTLKGSIPTAEASVKTKKKSKGGQKKSTSEPSLKIKIPVKQEAIEDLTEKLEDGAQSADDARPRDEQEPVGNITQNRQPVAGNIFPGDINSLYSDAYLATRLDEDYLTKAWLENDRECPWFCGKGSSDVVFEIEFPEFNSPDFNTLSMTALGVQLDALKKLSGRI